MSEDYKNFNESGETQSREGGDGAILQDSVSEDAAKVVDLQAKLDAQTDLYMRALADLDNFKKRMQREREEIRAAITSAILEDLLPVLDHFELGLQSAEDHKADKIVAGFSMVFEQLKRILTSYGLSEIVPLHQEFNPHEHECVRREYGETLPESTVTCVIRKGYKLNNRLIRPAMVAVSTKQQPEING
ncbi:MAG: nucleotide exchange factor GrpE [Puniceicoccales bacterium]|jgi:molecular chaperone GrpE|nr:nucleotide exchange factor GrpE [Puniceicoccales bacterium]